jgi:hypothetical protein
MSPLARLWTAVTHVDWITPLVHPGDPKRSDVGPPTDDGSCLWTSV